jgi:hypothetical protein
MQSTIKIATAQTVTLNVSYAQASPCWCANQPLCPAANQLGGRTWKLTKTNKTLSVTFNWAVGETTSTSMVPPGEYEIDLNDALTPPGSYSVTYSPQ